MNRPNCILKQSLILFYLCFLFSCGNSLEFKPPVFKKDFEHTMFKIGQTCGFKNVSFKVSATQKGNDKPEYEIQLTLINGQNIPGTERGLDSLAKKAAVILKKSIKNIHDYDWIFMVFDDPVLANVKKKTFGYKIKDIFYNFYLFFSNHLLTFEKKNLCSNRFLVKRK